MTVKAAKTGYVDGFILSFPKKNLDTYKKLAKVAAKVWTEHGALAYVEAIGDDLEPGFGLPFAKMVKPKKGEIIVFSYITYKSRAHRDAVNKKVMNDKRIDCSGIKMPFDVKRMAFGGFKTILSK